MAHSQAHWIQRAPIGMWDPHCLESKLWSLAKDSSIVSLQSEEIRGHGQTFGRMGEGYLVVKGENLPK